MALTAQPVAESSHLDSFPKQWRIVNGIKHQVILIPDDSMRILADTINTASLPPFIEQIFDPKFDVTAALRTVTPHRLQNDHGGRGEKGKWDARAHDVNSNEHDSGSRRTRPRDESRDAQSPRRGYRYTCPLTSFLEQQSPYTLAQGDTVVGDTVHRARKRASERGV
jgi:hypothetical protein